MAVSWAEQREAFALNIELESLTHRLNSQVVQYTPRGRAYNQNAPTLGDTANVAFLAATYAQSAPGQFSNKADRYWCWARTQMRYMLGDGGQR